ncbi:radical SAM protein [candidate division KSB1 bacterium]|nr:radical SAM protein [candidate division KSB1 bacterium]
MIPRRNFIREFKKALSQPDYAIRNFWRRLKSYLSYYLWDGKSAYPETISLFLTYRCNLRCTMCGQWGEVGSAKFYTPEMLRQELTPDVFLRLIDEVSSFKPNITLFGGEPLLYKGWDRIVQRAKEKGMRCNIITNGTLLERNAGLIVDLGVDEIIFSLDGPREIHDRIRGTMGTFDRAVIGLKKINELKEKRNRKKPQLNLAGTIFEDCYHHLEEMIDIAEDLRAKSITFHHLIFISQEIFDRHEDFFRPRFGRSCFDWAGFIRAASPRIDVDYLIEKIHEIKKRSSSVDISFYPNFSDNEVKRYYSNLEFEPVSYRNRCLSPWMVAYIFPDGSVRPFHSINFSGGNLKETGFKEIWNSDAYRDFRRVVKERKTFPVCSRCTELYRY